MASSNDCAFFYQQNATYSVKRIPVVTQDGVATFAFEGTTHMSETYMDDMYAAPEHMLRNGRARGPLFKSFVPFNPSSSGAANTTNATTTTAAAPKASSAPGSTNAMAGNAPTTASNAPRISSALAIASTTASFASQPTVTSATVPTVPTVATPSTGNAAPARAATSSTVPPAITPSAGNAAPGSVMMSGGAGAPPAGNAAPARAATQPNVTATFAPFIGNAAPGGTVTLSNVNPAIAPPVGIAASARAATQSSYAMGPAVANPMNSVSARSSGTTAPMVPPASLMNASFGSSRRANANASQYCNTRDSPFRNLAPISYFNTLGGSSSSTHPVAGNRRVDSSSTSTSSSTYVPNSKKRAAAVHNVYNKYLTNNLLFSKNSVPVDVDSDEIDFENARIIIISDDE
ncbi:hypothetical protein BDN70DRAFT_902218 [Pholiota conissans]|uniref:Uncharacterized protein n=1 Tax=Pholiota conissans TaxID=109636 RepID=A0A9P5YMH5_9AGAR|nr:hypothetical protein BDN70DRAFT_902218 [Pholiota conissans]